MTRELDQDYGAESDERSRIGLAHRRRLAAAIALLVAGAIGVIAGWIGATGTRLVSDQLSYIASSSLTGIFLLGLGSGLVVVDFMAQQSEGNEEIRRLLNRLLAQQSGVPGHTGGARGSSSAGGSTPSSDTLVAIKGGRKIHRSDCPLIAGKGSVHPVDPGEAMVEGCAVCTPALSEVVV